MNISNITLARFNGRGNFSKNGIKKINSNLSPDKSSEYAALVKEAPIEKQVYIMSEADIMDRIKNRIQISIDEMTRGNHNGENCK